MKRTALALTLTLVISLLFSCYLNHEVKAVTLGPLWDRSEELNVVDVVEINSPQNTTYSTNDILLNVTVTVDSQIYDVGYSVDGGEIERIDNLTKISEVPAYTLYPPFVRVTYTGSVSLRGLLDGSHNITVYDGVQYTGVDTRYEAFERANVIFKVATPPRITILSIENKTYNESNIPLNFTINEVGTQIKYSLDGKINVTTVGNMTLTGLGNGNHNLTVYATDEAGNAGASETMFFNVQVQEPFSTTLFLPISAVAVGLVLLGAGLLVYFKKCKV